MIKNIITTPISDFAISQLKIGDVFYLSGHLITSRDDVHHRLIKQNKALPIDLKQLAIFHAGPIMQKKAGLDSTYEAVSIGPTTSMRMEKYAAEFIAQTGLKIMVGKGGMGPKTQAACQEHLAVHAVFPGGCAVLAASCVEEVEQVEWLDLGMPEAMWVMRVKEFGPLIVSIDSHGQNLFAQNTKIFNQKKAEQLAQLLPQLDYLD